MSVVIGNAIVIVAVAASTFYAVWRLGPRSLRERMRVRLARYIPMMRLYPDFMRKGSAGGCSDCGTCAPSPPPRDRE